MKKLIFSVVLFAILVVLTSCSSSPKFSDVSGKTWKLVEVQIKDRVIKFDRKALVGEGFGEIFTLNFDASNLSGAGAPNRYNAPYALSGKQGISVRPMRSTLMASIYDPEKLREQEFFIYMQNVTEWTLVNKHLQLTTKNAQGDKVVLIFAL